MTTHTLYTAYTINTVGTVYIVDTVDTVNTIQTDLQTIKEQNVGLEKSGVKWIRLRLDCYD